MKGLACVAVLGALAGCRDRAIASCADRLTGVWIADRPAPGGEPLRWHLLDRGSTVEAFAIVDELTLSAAPTTHDAVIPAPAVLDLSRTGAELTGHHARRFARGSSLCTMRTPARLHGCRGATAILDLGPRAAPTDWSLCTPGTGEATSYTLRRE